MTTDVQEALPIFGEGMTVGKCTPEELQIVHQDFKKRNSRALGGRGDLASTKRQLVIQIENAAGGKKSALGQRAVKCFEDACETRDLHAEERRHGLKGAGQTLQDSLFAFSRFAAAYSDILDAVNSAAGPYAQVGWQTMSILLVVVVNKRKNDDKLQDHMDRIQKLLPRLGQWKDIYHNEGIGQQMQELVANTYDLVIEFSRAVVDYCCHFWKRVLPAVIPIFRVHFDDVAQSVYELLAEINATANVGLHARTQSIENQVKELRQIEQELLATNKALKTRLDKQAEQDDDRRFHALEQLLDSKIDHPGLSLRSTKAFLQSAFPESQYYSPRDPYSTYEQMYPARIMSHPMFRAWFDSSQSSLLFINGHTQRDGRHMNGVSACWLSPAAIHIGELCENGSVSVKQGQVAFFSCRPDLGQRKPHAVEVLAATALRLVAMRKEILRDHLEDLEQALRGPTSSPQSSHSSCLRGSSTPLHPNYSPEGIQSPLTYSSWSPSITSKRFGIATHQPTLEQLTDVILAILAALAFTDGKAENTTRFIVLDRLDSVDGVQINIIMNELARITFKSECRVKIVVVVETSQMEGYWRVQDVPVHLAPPDRLFDLHIDQHQLPWHGRMDEKKPQIWADVDSGR